MTYHVRPTVTPRAKLSHHRQRAVTASTLAALVSQTSAVHDDTMRCDMSGSAAVIGTMRGYRIEPD
jgi:leucyl aminopeptidase